MKNKLNFKDKRNLNLSIVISDFQGIFSIKIIINYKNKNKINIKKYLVKLKIYMKISLI